MFGAKTTPAAPAGSGLFGAAPAGGAAPAPAAGAAAPAAGGLFGAAAPAAAGAAPAAAATAPAGGGLFGAALGGGAAGGAAPVVDKSGLFGGAGAPSAAPAAAAPAAAGLGLTIAASGTDALAPAATSLGAAAGAKNPDFLAHSRLHNKKLLDIMDDFRLRLGEQVNTFTQQALEVDERDRQLIQERDRVLQLTDTTQRLKQNAAGLNAELELILQRQDEMHAALAALEKKVEEEAAHFRQLERPSERQRAYQLAEHLDTELGQTREELAECVGQLNQQRQAEAGADDAHKLAQLVEVMDVHLNALNYLESQSNKLDATLQQADAMLGGQSAMQRAWLREHGGALQ